MGLSEAYANRDSWDNTKTDLEGKKRRMEDAQKRYSSANDGDFTDAYSSTIKYYNSINTGFSYEWEGQKVQEYKADLQTNVYDFVMKEASAHWTTIADMRTKITELENDIANAQDQINYWNDVIRELLEDDDD